MRIKFKKFYTAFFTTSDKSLRVLSQIREIERNGEERAVVAAGACSAALLRAIASTQCSCSTSANHSTSYHSAGQRCCALRFARHSRLSKMPGFVVAFLLENLLPEPEGSHTTRQPRLDLLLLYVPTCVLSGTSGDQRELRERDPDLDPGGCAAHHFLASRLRALSCRRMQRRWTLLSQLQ